MNSGNKLRTYATFEHHFLCKSYINPLKFQERQALCKLRTTAHKLEIERGRYKVPKTQVCNRFCKQCNTGFIDDEQHFFIRMYQI